jgi:hypothetical protein
VSAALRSEQTPPFPQMVAQLFERGDVQQRTGMLSQLIGNISPAVLASLTAGRLGSAAGGNGARVVVTPNQASQVTPAQVEQIAAHAQDRDPGIVDTMGEFYAQHPDLVKTIGGAALAFALGKIAEHMRR